LSGDDGHHADQAVFAAGGLSRQWLVRAAVLGGAALLATWLVALALGAMGGFEALPSLPGQSSGESREVNSGKAAKPAPVTQRGDQRRGGAEEPVSDAGSSAPSRTVSRPAPERTPRLKPAPTPVVSAPTTTTAATTKPGKRLGTTQTGGPPVESPGNGPGGAGPPGQSG
jgi:hypothetical protein